jgi:cytochrome c-type biogenesis protein CcmF
MTVLGIVSESAWNIERIQLMKPGQTVEVGRYDVTFDGILNRDGPNYREEAAHFTVREGGVIVASQGMEPARRLFTARQMPTSETVRATFGFSQLYIALGETDANGTGVRIYWKPLVLLIWLGAVVMGLGGLFSLADRRLRVGAPVPARKPTAKPPASAVPAE